MDKPDVRKTVRVDHPVTGAQIVDALKQLAGEVRSEYAERLLADVDGDKFLKVGLSSGYPYADVTIRTGQGLVNEGVQLQASYDVFGVGTTNWPGCKYAVGYDDSSVVNAVEKVRDGLEKLL